MITLASCITMLRIVLAPIIVYYIKLAQWQWAAVFFIVAALTDLLDGFVARTFNQQTKFGQLLDPIADKCLIMMTLYSLLIAVPINSFQQILIWLLLGKEAILLAGGAFLKLRYNFFIVPSKLSRAASLAEIFLILFLLSSLLLLGDVAACMFSALLVVNLAISVWLLMRYVLIVIKQ